MRKLHAARFANDLTSPAMLEQFDGAGDIGLRWDIYEGGLVKAEVTVKCRNKTDLYNRRNSHLDQRLAIYDSTIYHNASGFIFEAAPAGANRLKYIAAGPARRGNARLDTTLYATTAQIDNTIKTILTDHVAVADSDQSNIAANTTTLGGWQTEQPQGSYGIDAIKDLLKKSDSSNNVYDFWLRDQPLRQNTLDLWLPYYKARSSSADVDWKVSLDDLRGFEMPSRDIYDLRTSVKVYYGVVTGAASSGSNTTCVRASGSFITDGVKPGDRIQNVTDNSRATVTAVTALTLTIDGLSGGTADVFASSDVYTIQLEQPKSSSATSTTAEYHDRDYAVFERGMNTTQAGQYDDTLLQTGAQTRVKSFVVGSPWILDGKGARHPLWDVVFLGGGYIQITDLYPTATLFSTSQDSDQAFFVTALDYLYNDNSLRVTVDDPDGRLDARLQREKIIGSTGIFT